MRSLYGRDTEPGGRVMTTESLDLEPNLAAETLTHAVDRLREAEVALPTFAQLADPTTIPTERASRPARHRSRCAAPAQPLPRPLAQRRVAAGHHGGARPRRPRPGADGRRRADRGRSRRPLPADPRAQGARRLRLPRAASRRGRVRPGDAACRLAVDRQLLPRRRRDLPPARLPRRRRPAGRDEPGAVRLARALGRATRPT